MRVLPGIRAGGASGARRRARPLVALALLAALLPLGRAHADHLACGAAGQPPCPIFAPDLSAGPQVPYTDVPSSITYRVSAADHTMPVVRATYYVPKGWHFYPKLVRPAEQSTGVPATNCSQIFSELGTHRDNRPATLGRAENLAGGVGLTAHTDDTRETGPRNAPPPNGGPTPPAQFGYFASNSTTLAFLRWREAQQTADLCLYLYARDFRLDHANDPSDPCNVRGTVPQFQPSVRDPNCERAREHLIPVTLAKIDASDPLAGEFGWRIDYAFDSFFADPALHANNVSLLSSLFYIDGYTGGNWNTNPHTGGKERIVFSRTPATAGSYTFRADLSTCAEGFNAPGGGTVCRNGNLSTLTRSVVVDITPPPDALIHDFAHLTGPAGPGAMPAGFGYVVGSEATIAWHQPAVNAAEPLKGYVLAVARPGDVDHVHYQYIVTDASSPAFDPRMPCGPDGQAGNCAVTLAFPLNTGTDRILTADGRYDVGLVTIYADGHRSDGRCDDATPQGAPCSPDASAFRVNPPGLSTWQFYISERPWPDVFVQSRGVQPSGSRRSFTAPAYLLLVDTSAKQARFVIWNWNGPSTTYSATSATIVGDRNAAALSFASAPTTGQPGFAFNGWMAPAGPQPHARGLFVRYDAKGFPGVPNGVPTASTIEFQGTRL